MLNDYYSWYDSDEIDSDTEQEAYSLLYNVNIDNFSININKTNIINENIKADKNIKADTDGILANVKADIDEIFDSNNYFSDIEIIENTSTDSVYNDEDVLVKEDSTLESNKMKCDKDNLKSNFADDNFENENNQHKFSVYEYENLIDSCENIILNNENVILNCENEILNQSLCKISEHIEIIKTNDNDDISSILINSSETILIDDNSSDSDDIQYIQTVFCKDPVTAICIGSSSEEESNYIEISKDINNSPVVLNISNNNLSYSSDSDSDYETINKSTIDNASLMLNINSKLIQNKTQEMNKVDKLFFSQKETSESWSVDYKPLPKSRYSSRYFESSSSSVCDICLKKGHSNSECTRSGPVCILCGNEGHISKRCDKVVCYVCYQSNHLKNCPLTTKFLRIGCRRCGQRGHSEEICPDVWRQYKYTTSQGAPIMKQCSSQNKGSVYCANCAKTGHFTEQCPRSRMNSQFIGPPPIMEIIKFENRDIYNHAGLTYSLKSESNTSSDSITVEFPSFIDNMDVTEIVSEKLCVNNDDNTSESMEIDDSISQFGNGFIMLSPIKSKSPAFKRSFNGTIKNNNTSMMTSSNVNCSTPNQPQRSSINEKQSMEKIVKPITKLPGITTELLRKLFPEETENHEKLPPALRKVLRKKLKNLIDHGYLPGDTNITQERMEFWLQEISTGRNLNYREKKKLLGSVSAALHSISGRVSGVETVDLTSQTDSSSEIITKPNTMISIPEHRKLKNKLNKQEKTLKNTLKISRKERKEKRKMEIISEKSIKYHLRNADQTTNNGEPIAKKRKVRQKNRNKKPNLSEMFQ